jgi:DNA replication factor GINS
LFSLYIQVIIAGNKKHLEDEMNSNNKNEDRSLSIKDVYDILLKEIQAPTLLYIPLDTYQDIAIALAKLKGQAYEGLEAKIRNRMAELMSQSAQLLIEARHHKIMEQQQNIESPPEASFSTTTPFTSHRPSIASIDYSKLTDEEKYIFDAEKEVEKRKYSILMAIFSGRPKILESISAKIRSKEVVVRFTKPMERFVGTDMTKYGPFKQEDVAVLPFENARSLIDNGEAIEINPI